MSSSSGTSGLPILTSTSAGAAERPCSFRTRRMPGLSTLSEWLNGECGVARMSARMCGGRTPIDGKKWADRRLKPFSLPSSVARHVTTSTPRVLLGSLGASARTKVAKVACLPSVYSGFALGMRP